MSKAYTKLYVQLIFCVKYRKALISPDWEDDLFKYITGIVKNHDMQLIAINGVPDHIHMLIRMRPTSRLADLVREIKKASTQFINDGCYLNTKFQWQSGYGAFSYSRSAVPDVVNYINRQKQHHAKKSLLKEYTEFLGEHEVEYDPKYLNIGLR